MHNVFSLEIFTHENSCSKLFWLVYTYIFTCTIILNSVLFASFIMQIKIQFGPSRLFLHLLLCFGFLAVTISPTPQKAALFCAFECASFSLCCGGHSVFSLIVILQTTVLIACIWFNSNSSILITSLCVCVFASLLSWLTGTLRFGEEGHQRNNSWCHSKMGVYKVYRL